MTKSKQKEAVKSNEIETAINTIKEQKEKSGVIKATNKKILIEGGKDFSGKSLRIQKGFFKDGQSYFYVAGTKWEDIDAFGRKNIHFSESDFV